jgi:ABC-type transport system involved in multi-copper enzyme maturation permease subunit
LSFFYGGGFHILLNMSAVDQKYVLRAVKQIFSISRTTALEAIQEPVVFLIMLTAVLMTVMAPLFQFNRFSEDGRLARDGGLSSMLILGLVLAAGTAGRAVASEIESGTASAIIGKPVSRSIFVLAKALGIFQVVLIFWCGQLSATLIAERISAHFVTVKDFAGYATDRTTLIFSVGALLLVLLISALVHYVRRQRFGVVAFIGIALSQVVVVLISGFYSRMGRPFYVFGEAGCGCGDAHHHAASTVLYDPELNLRVIPAAILILFVLAVFVSLATALSTRLQSGAAMIVCVLVMIFGLAGDALTVNTHLISMRGVLAGILPDIQHFWLCDALAHGGQISMGYLIEAGLYAATCCAFFLTAGCIAFANRDLG